MKTTQDTLRAKPILLFDLSLKEVRKKNRMTIWIGIDIHKKKCVATQKRDSQEIVEQTSLNPIWERLLESHDPGIHRKHLLSLTKTLGVTRINVLMIK